MSEAIDAVFEEFGVPATLGNASVLVRRAPAVPAGDAFTLGGWKPDPERAARPVLFLVRRAEVAVPLVGGRLRVLSGDDAGFYDLVAADPTDGGVIWSLSVRPLPEGVPP